MFHGNNINHEDVSALSLIQRKGRCTQNLQVNSERFFVCSVQNELRKKFLGKAVYLGFAISVPCVVTTHEPWNKLTSSSLKQIFASQTDTILEGVSFPPLLQRSVAVALALSLARPISCSHNASNDVRLLPAVLFCTSST